MSTTLLTADNISVKGHHYKARTYNSLPTPSGPHIYWDPQSTSDQNFFESDAVHLDFTLLINGKLKTFGWSFIVEDGKELGHDWTLAQWSDWNAIYFVLWNLGYQIDDRETSFGQAQVHKWISQIMN
jgi:hypothetical protein